MASNTHSPLPQFMSAGVACNLLFKFPGLVTVSLPRSVSRDCDYFLKDNE